MRFHRARWIAPIIAFGLVVAACGEEREQAEPAATTAPPSGDATTTTAPAGEMFGTLESPCGDGDASGATATGVTDDKILFGYGDDAGYASSPGLNHEMSDAVEALIDWCNEQGGINGRTLEGKYYDAKILDVNNAVISACNDGVFMLVGEGWALDASQEEARVGCGLGAVPAYTVSPEFAHGPFMAAPVPNPTDVTPVQHAAAFQRAFPEQIKKSAALYANFAATQDTIEKAEQSYPAYGFEFLGCDQQYNIGGEDDWKPFVQNLKDCGAEVVLFAGDPNPNFQNFLVAAGQLDYEPLYILDANFYKQTFADWNAANGGAGDNSYVRQAYIPLEEADSNPATKQYIDLVTAHGGDINQLGAQAASAFLLWATAVDACGSEVTRDCVFEQIGAIEDWTGGGLHAPTKPGANLPPECGITVKLEGGTYVRFDPTTPGEFDCDPEYLQPVSGEIVDRVQLDANRVSTKYTG
jgi:ABC-type branched-subunit amino acid transport system substrate-binding protein